MKDKKCMFNHNICIKEECTLYFDSCLFRNLCLVLYNHFNEVDHSRNIGKFSGYMQSTDVYEIILDIVGKNNILETEEEKLFIEFLKYNGIDDNEIDNYLIKYENIFHYLSIYKMLVKEFGNTNKIEEYFYDYISKEKKDNENKRKEQIFTTINNFVKYLKSINVKTVYKKDVYHYYQQNTELYINGFECDEIIRHIKNNNLMEIKK